MQQLDEQFWRDFRSLQWRRFEALARLDSYTLGWQGHDARLVIDCPNPPSVDVLMERLDEVRSLVWVILGADELAIYFTEEEIWQGSTKSELSLESTAFTDFEDEDMTTLTEQPPVAVQDAVQQAITPAIDQAIDTQLEQIATDGTLASMILDRVKTRVPSFVDKWLNSLNSERNGATAMAVAEPSTTTESQAEATENGTAPAATIKVGVNYSSTLFKALSAFIAEPKERQAMLTQIRRGTKKGTEFLERVVVLYPQDKQAKAREGLKKAIDNVKSKLTK